MSPCTTVLGIPKVELIYFIIFESLIIYSLLLFFKEINHIYISLSIVFEERNPPEQLVGARANMFGTFLVNIERPFTYCEIKQ